jgi:hypothetical protein
MMPTGNRRRITVGDIENGELDDDEIDDRMPLLSTTPLQYEQHQRHLRHVRERNAQHNHHLEQQSQRDNHGHISVNTDQNRQPHHNQPEHSQQQRQTANHDDFEQSLSTVPLEGANVTSGCAQRQQLLDNLRPIPSAEVVDNFMEQIVHNNNSEQQHQHAVPIKTNIEDLLHIWGDDYLGFSEGAMLLPNREYYRIDGVRYYASQQRRIEEAKIRSNQKYVHLYNVQCHQDFHLISKV